MIDYLRKCRDCGLEAKTEDELEFFPPNKGSKHGRETRCKKCKNEYMRLWKKKRGGYNQTRRGNIATLKKTVISLYGGRCECCGETNHGFLTMDHINNDGSIEYEKMGWVKMYKNMYNSILTDKAYARKHYRVLCYNCNCGRERNGGMCPHNDPKFNPE